MNQPAGTTVADPGRPIATVDLACPLCAERAATVLYQGREHEYRTTTTELFPVVRCAGCGLVRLNPRPAVEELGRIYPPEYYAYHLVTDDAGGRPGIGERIKAKMYQRRLGALVARLGKPAGTIRLLDVGCADGRLLDWYRSGPIGARLETHGIEMSEEAAATARARGHHVASGRFETDRTLEAGTYDLILAFHVIEHVDDPIAFAARAAELLAPGGLFVVATPNIDSWDARRFGRDWGGNHFPRHWTFFDPDSMARVAERVGLVQERVEYQLNPVFWNWSFHAWARRRYPDAGWPDATFPPVSIFRPSARSFVLLGLFTTVDGLLRRFTRRTASMSSELRKPTDTA